MGTPGVPFDPPRELIVAAIKKYKGVVSHIAIQFDVTVMTMRRYLNKDPELCALLEEARICWVDELCDVAEGTLLHTVGQREDLSAAMRAVQFALNNHGRKRGYIHPGANDDSKQEAANAAAARQIDRVIDALAGKSPETKAE